MPHGGYIKTMGSGATFVKLFSCVSYPATDSICVGLVSDFSQSHFPAYCCLVRSFYQVLVIVQRDGVSLTLSRLSYVPTNLPVYPAGVRGVDLSV